MSKNNLISLIVLDVIVMILAIALMAYRYQGITSQSVSATVQQQKAKTETSQKPAQNEPVKPEPTAATEPAADMQRIAAETQQAVQKPVKGSTESRNISFVYKNSKVKKVEVIADFTDWIPVKMAKGANSTWKLNMALAPGEYAYNFVIDGKPKRDPNNPKICNAGRGFPNSYLKVKSLSNEN
jgi:Tfp pilus assembly major pilin PilA